jgi:hypothetical protein
VSKEAEQRLRHGDLISRSISISTKIPRSFHGHPTHLLYTRGMKNEIVIPEPHEIAKRIGLCRQELIEIKRAYRLAQAAVRANDARDQRRKEKRTKHA